MVDEGAIERVLARIEACEGDMNELIQSLARRSPSRWGASATRS